MALLEFKRYPHYRVELRLQGKDLIGMVAITGAYVLRVLGVNTLVDMVVLMILISYFGFESYIKAKKSKG